MDNKSFLELKKRFKKNECTINRIYTCYINAEGEKICNRDENFLVMRDEKENDFHKFLDLQKKTLSMKSSDLDFSEEKHEEIKKLLKILYKNELKDKEVLNILIDKLSEAYLKCVMGNFLITIICDSYDVPTKTTDGFKVDESEEVYQYIICSICPVSTSKAGLGYIEKDNTIASRYQDFVVNPPEVGFIYPSFTDRSSDDSTITYLVRNKNKNKMYNAIMEEVLNCVEVSSEDVSEKEEFIDDIKEKKLIVEEIKEEIKDVVVEEVEKEDIIQLKDERTEIYESKDIIEESKNNEIIFDNNEKLEEKIDDKNDDFVEKLQNENNDFAKSVVIEENSEADDEFSKFLNKINLLIDEHKGKAEIQIINGKKFLMIPME